MAAKKQELFESPSIPCAYQPCRFPGRLWVRTLPHDERLCINHYYDALARDHSLSEEDTVPPKTKMPGVEPKAVAGRD